MSTNITNEFSFVLRPSVHHGIGVFSVHDIKKDTPMRLFGDTNPRRFIKKDNVPQEFRNFCVDREDKLICPPDFGYMPLGWYINHSKNANTEPRGGYFKDGYHFFAKRNIKSGEEITVDYNTLEEPDSAKQDYYQI